MLPTKRWSRPAFAVPALIMIIGFAAYAAAPTIEDRANIFSKSALAQGNQIVEAIYQETRPHKDVAVVTFEHLPAGISSAEELAGRLFRERSVDGLLMLAIKDPGRLRVAVGRGTQAHFTTADRDQLVEVMLTHFRKKNFDEGLLAGLGFARSKLVSAFPLSGGSRASEDFESQEGARRLAEPSRGLPTWLWAVIVFAGVWIVLAIFRSLSQPSAPIGGTGPTPGGYGSSGYGGWGQSILGGLFGAMAGNWIYDQFSGRGGGSAYGSLGERMSTDDSRSDDGQVGSVGGDDWQDSDRDSGGDDTGGGDFGGGGDDGGGGDF